MMGYRPKIDDWEGKRETVAGAQLTALNLPDHLIRHSDAALCAQWLAERCTLWPLWAKDKTVIT
jgi:hypothetical protein